MLITTKEGVTLEEHSKQVEKKAEEIKKHLMKKAEEAKQARIKKDK